MSKLPTVVIVGRTNVGKSTLFNRLSTEVKSITLDFAGVTRDMIKDRVEWAGKAFELIDTGGIDLHTQPDVIAEKVREQVLGVIKSADVVVFAIDGVVGITLEDREIANFVHSLKKPTIVAVNKIDRKESSDQAHEAYKLGFKHVVMVSAQHGIAIGDLLEAIIELLPDETSKKDIDTAFKVTLLGRPNVGKSSLMNTMLKEERSIVSEIAGTTREPITEKISFYKEHISLTDTPGIRRRKTIDTEIETIMIKRAFSAVRDTDIILLLIDATEGSLVAQDLKLAFYAFTQQYKGLIILLNKWDILTDEMRASLEACFGSYEYFLDKVPVLRVSAKTGKNVGHVLPTINEVWQRINIQIDKSALNSIIKSALRERPLMHAKNELIVKKAYQVKTAPITIVLEVNEPAWFQDSQLAFFENLLRAHYDLLGAPIRFLVRKS